MLTASFLCGSALTASALGWDTGTAEEMEEEEGVGGGLPVMTALPSEGRKARSLALSVSRAFPVEGLTA